MPGSAASTWSMPARTRPDRSSAASVGADRPPARPRPGRDMPWARPHRGRHAAHLGLVLAVAVPTGLGAGALDGGANGLILDLYRSSRGRALNLPHLCFSLEALAALLAIGQPVEGGVPWEIHRRGTRGPAACRADDHRRDARRTSPRRCRPLLPSGRVRPAAVAGSGRLTRPLLLLAIAIGCYVPRHRHLQLARALPGAGAADAGDDGARPVLGWPRTGPARCSPDRPVRPCPLAIATTVAMRRSHGRDPRAVDGGLDRPLRARGFATGLVYPTIMAIGGDRYPHRSAAVSGLPRRARPSPSDHLSTEWRPVGDGGADRRDARYRGPGLAPVRRADPGEDARRGGRPTCRCGGGEHRARLPSADGGADLVRTPRLRASGGLDHPLFRLRPLGPEHNASDYAAWTSSMAYVAATPGFAGSGWPHEMTLDGDRRTFERHAADFRATTTCTRSSRLTGTRSSGACTST